MLSKFVGCRMVGKARQVRAPRRPVQGQPVNFDKTIFEELGVNKLKVFVLQREVVIPADAKDALRRASANQASTSASVWRSSFWKLQKSPQ